MIQSKKKKKIAMHWRVLSAYYGKNTSFFFLLNYNKGFIADTSAWTKNANKALILTIIKILFFHHVLAIKYRKRCCSVQKSTGIFFIKAYTFFSICKKRKKAKNSVDVLEEIFQNNVKKNPVDLVVILQTYAFYRMGLHSFLYHLNFRFW